HQAFHLSLYAEDCPLRGHFSRRTGKAPKPARENHRGGFRENGRLVREALFSHFKNGGFAGSRSAGENDKLGIHVYSNFTSANGVGTSLLQPKRSAMWPHIAFAAASSP